MNIKTEEEKRRYFIRNIFDNIRANRDNENVYEKIQDLIMCLIVLGKLPFELGFRIFKGIAKIHQPHCKAPHSLENITEIKLK